MTIEDDTRFAVARLHHYRFEQAKYQAMADIADGAQNKDYYTRQAARAAAYAADYEQELAK